MYKRQKVALSLLQVIGGPVNDSYFQMMMFLVSAIQQKSSYDFLPHPVGCYSYQLEADRLNLMRQGVLKQSAFWDISSCSDFDAKISLTDKEIIRSVTLKNKEHSSEELKRRICINYPFFAINCTNREGMVRPSDMSTVIEARPVFNDEGLYTIGYEGKSVEKYVCTLIERGIKCLIDVRRNAFSRKFGFSKLILKTAVESVGIEYVHIPQLGIDSSYRGAIENEIDFQRLMSQYESTLLSEQSRNLSLIAGKLRFHRRIALTCFEASCEDCHRKPLSTCIKEAYFPSVTVVHL